MAKEAIFLLFSLLYFLPTECTPHSHNLNGNAACQISVHQACIYIQVHIHPSAHTYIYYCIMSYKYIQTSLKMHTQYIYIHAQLYKVTTADLTHRGYLILKLHIYVLYIVHMQLNIFRRPLSDLLG